MNTHLLSKLWFAAQSPETRVMVGTLSLVGFASLSLLVGELWRPRSRTTTLASMFSPGRVTVDLIAVFCWAIGLGRRYPGGFDGFAHELNLHLGVGITVGLVGLGLFAVTHKKLIR
jgi:hypothetical protein